MPLHELSLLSEPIRTTQLKGRIKKLTHGFHDYMQSLDELARRNHKIVVEKTRNHAVEIVVNAAVGEYGYVMLQLRDVKVGMLQEVDFHVPNKGEQRISVRRSRRKPLMLETRNFYDKMGLAKSKNDIEPPSRMLGLHRILRSIDPRYAWRRNPLAPYEFTLDMLEKAEEHYVSLGIEPKPVYDMTNVTKFPGKSS